MSSFETLIFLLGQTTPSFGYSSDDYIVMAVCDIYADALKDGLNGNEALLTSSNEFFQKHYKILGQ
jgi:hypothetical protein